MSMLLFLKSINDDIMVWGTANVVDMIFGLDHLSTLLVLESISVCNVDILVFKSSQRLACLTGSCH